MRKIICIVCPNSCEINIEKVEEQYKISGNLCARGGEYAINEMVCPKRSICSTVKTTYKEMPRLPVRTDTDIPLGDIFNVMDEINKIEIDHPVHCGDILIKNVFDTGSNIIATSDMYELLEGMNS